jgi:hypothetical protein
MQAVSTLRAASCDALTVLTDTLIAASGAKKTYFLESTSASTPSSITVPAKSAASCPLAAAGTREPLLLAASPGHPTQLDLHREDSSGNSVVVEKLLSVDAPAAVQSIYVRHDVVVVQSQGADHTALNFYRLDTSRAIEAGSLRHLGACIVPVSSLYTSGSDGAAPLWLVDVSASQVGVQEAVIATRRPDAASGTYVAIVDISGTIASQRASIVIPHVVSTPVVRWTVNWSRREVVAVFGDLTFGAISLTAVASRSACWSSTRRALPAGSVEVFGVCALGDGSVWIASAASNKSTCAASLVSLSGADAHATIAIGSGPVSSIAAHDNDIYVLHGKKILKHHVVVATGASSSLLVTDAASTSSSSSSAISAENVLKALFGGSSSIMKSALATTSSSTAADQWVEFLLGEKKTAKRPTAVLRDADFVVPKSDATSNNGHRILDRLLTSNKHHASNNHAAPDAVLRYFSECTSVEASSLIRTFVHYKSAAFQLSVWSLVSLQSASDASALEHLSRQHIAHLRQQTAVLDGQTIADLFLATCDAIDGALEANIPRCVALGAALVDALVVVHGKVLLDVGGQHLAQRWSSVASSLSSLSAWALEWAAPAMGQVTAHCGSPLHASKEAQFIASNARRIRTTKEADIHRSTIALEAPSVTRAHKKQ